MENICLSLTYYVLNIFDCIKLIHSMETMFESLCFIIICSLGSFHHYVSYVIIFILLITIYYTLFTIHPKSRYINIAFTLKSLIVYPVFMLICVLDCLSNSNDLVICCCIICVLYPSIINPHPHLHVHLNIYPLILHLNRISIFNEHYVYSYINHYSCTIHFHNKDRGTQFCCGVSMSFAQSYIYMFSDYITTDI